eukprot:233967_1
MQNIFGHCRFLQCLSALSQTLVSCRMLQIRCIVVCVIIVSLINASIIFDKITDVNQLTPWKDEATLSLQFLSFTDKVDNSSYHFLSNMLNDGDDSTILSNIYGNNLKQWNDTKNPINSYYSLPFTTTYSNDVSNPYGAKFQQCSNPVTNDIILCYDSFLPNEYDNMYIFCKIFYNNDYNNTNKPYWTDEFIVTSAVIADPGFEGFNVVCFNDSYFIIWLGGIYNYGVHSINYTLIDLSGNIKEQDITIYQVDVSKVLTAYNLKTVKAKFNDNNFMINFILDGKTSHFPYYYAYIMGEYTNIDNIQFINSTNPNFLKLYDPSNNDQFRADYHWYPISMYVNNDCCYILPYTVVSFTTYHDSIYYTMIDKNGQQILNNKCILIETAATTDDLYQSNQMIELFMLNNNNDTKYFMSLYSLFIDQEGTTPQSITGKVYSIDSKYNFNILNKTQLFVNNLRGINGNEVCGDILNDNNNNTLIISWTNWNLANPFVQASFAQSWSVTNDENETN